MRVVMVPPPFKHPFMILIASCKDAFGACMCVVGLHILDYSEMMNLRKGVHMFTNLIDEAKKEGIENVHVAALVRNAEDQVLLIEKVLQEKPIYEFPTADVKEGETIQQALQRAVLEETAMELGDVKAYLGHYDVGQDRYYHFVTEVKDPCSIEQNTKIAYAWLETQEAVGYPITDDLREMLDVYAKMQQA
ncbi:NUDIX hydrolase [Simkania sp.]|uniref:NUDIX hydrolase n=1 Tax=Simkania sp. TaxID=34094 RepID=UPI003B526BDB